MKPPPLSLGVAVRRFHFWPKLLPIWCWIAWMTVRIYTWRARTALRRVVDPIGAVMFLMVVGSVTFILTKGCW